MAGDGWTLKGNGAPVLHIVRQDTQWDDEWAVTLDLTDARGTARVHERHSGDALRLDDYFTALAEQWRGWDGSITWEATGMSMAAENDGKGHIAVHVEVWADPFIADRWTLRGTIMLDAGSLDRISREARAADS